MQDKDSLEASCILQRFNRFSVWIKPYSALDDQNVYSNCSQPGFYEIIKPPNKEKRKELHESMVVFSILLKMVHRFFHSTCIGENLIHYTQSNAYLWPGLKYFVEPQKLRKAGLELLEYHIQVECLICSTTGILSQIFVVCIILCIVGCLAAPLVSIH